MESVENILTQARARASQTGLSYAGAVTPQEAYAVISQDSSAVLVDVRSRAELELVKAKVELQKMQREEEAARAEHQRTMEAAAAGMVADEAQTEAKIRAAKAKPTNGGTA